MKVHTKPHAQGSLSKCMSRFVTAGFQSTILLGFLCCWYYGVMHFLSYMTYFIHEICYWIIMMFIVVINIDTIVLGGLFV